MFVKVKCIVDRPVPDDWRSFGDRKGDVMYLEKNSICTVDNEWYGMMSIQDKNGDLVEVGNKLLSRFAMVPNNGNKKE